MTRRSNLEIVRTVHPTAKHPLTGAPIVSEFTLRGRPVWTPMGGDETAGGGQSGQQGGDGSQGGQQGGEGGQGGDGGQGGGSQQGGEGQNGGSQQGGQGGEGAGQQQSGNVWDDPAKAKAEIERLRNENARDRTTARENAATEERNRVLKALGLNTDGSEEVTVEKLSEQLASRDAQLASQAREISASKAIRAHSGDADALGDSRAFNTELAKLDPADDGFDAKVDALVKKTITDNPKFKQQAQAAGQSGGEFSGGSGEQQQNRPTSLNAAIAASYKK